MDELIILDSKDKKLSIEYLYCIEDYHTMIFKVESLGFKGHSNFCISKEDMKNIIKSLKLAKEELTGSVEIKDRDSDAHISITMMNLGKLIVSGQIGGSFEDHYFRFKFESDQTILNELRSFFVNEL